MSYELRLKVGKETYRFYGVYLKLVTAKRHADAIRQSLLYDGRARMEIHDVTGRSSVRVKE